MSTTTVRLSPELKSRVQDAAQRAGVSTHSFIIEAIAEKTLEAEQQADFHQTADARFAKFLATGKSIPWDKMRRYLMSQSEAKPTPKPRARKFVG